jgi:hypothetical protein
MRVLPRLFVLGLGALLVLGALPTPASASHSWGKYHWARESNSFTLQVGDNVHDAWDTYLDEAIVDWNPSAPVDLVKIAGGTNPRRCNPTSGRIEVCAEKYGRNGWLGPASIWASGDHIVQATAKMNDTYFNMATYDTPAWRRLVMCQEIAHDWGLGHQDENHSNENLGSCMNYTSNPLGPPSNEHPNQHDFDQTDIIYGHLDDTTTVASSGQTAGLSGVESPDPSGAEQGGVSVFVTDLGGGNQIIQFVIWADANLIAASHANENAPVAGTTTHSDGIPVDGGSHDHEETAGTTVVTTDAVNLRAAPSRQAAIITELAAGTSLTVTGPAEWGQGIEWVPVVTAEGATGYVAAEFLAVG